MKKIYLVIVFFNIFHLAFGQSDIEMRVDGDFSRCQIWDVKIDKNNNRIVTGSFRNNDGGSALSILFINSAKYNLPSASGFFCFKLNQKKEVLWLKTIHGNIGLGYAYSVLDDSSNVYVIGKLQQVLRFDENTTLDGPTGDIFVAKYTNEGKLKWAKKYGGSSDNASLRPTNDKNGNLYILGRYQKSLEVEGKQVLKSIGQNTEPYLLKLDRNGNYIWAKGFDEKFEVNAVSINKNYDVFLSGNFKGSITINENLQLQSTGDKDIFYAKFDQNGQILWAKIIGGSQRDDNHVIEADDFGNIYLAGVISNEAKFDTLQVNVKSEKGVNIFLAKIESNKGKIVWVRNMTYGYDVYDYHDTVKFLKLNNAGEPYFFGMVLDFLNIGEDIKFKGNYYKGLEYLIKYSTDGKLINAVDAQTSVGYGLTVWSSMSFSNQNEMLIASNNDVSASRYSYTVASLFKKIELNENSCNNNTIPIERDYPNLLSISKTVFDYQNFNYQWYKNGESITNATQASFPAEEVGYYSLKLTNKTNNSCQISSSNTIAIYSPLATPPVLFVYTINKNLFTNASYSRIEWYKDNILIANASDRDYYYTQDGTYKFKRFYDNSGVFQESNEIIIKDGLTTTINKTITYDDGDKCKPVPYLKVGFKDVELPENTSFYKFQWFLNGNSIKDSINTHFKPITTGDYHVSVFVPTDNKTYTSGKYKIVIEDFPKSLSIKKIEDNCGAKALLKVDDSFMQRYTFQSVVWRLDGKDIPDANYPFLNVTKSGYYTFSVKYIDNANAVTCNYNSFVAFDKKTDFKLNVGYAYAGSACVVDSFKVFVPYDKNYTYEWTKNDVPIKNQTSNELFVQDKSRYKSYVKRTDGCVNETDEISLKGCTPVSSDKFIILNPPLISAEKTSFYTDEKSILSSNGCTNTNLQWLKDTQAIVGANKTTLEVKESGNYALQIEKLGCIATTNIIKISVETVLAVGEEVLPFDIEVYPNPTEEKLFVSIPSQINSPIAVKMTDISGKLIDNYDFSETKSKTIDLKTLQEGVYFLVFETNGKRVVKKIIKKD